MMIYNNINRVLEGRAFYEKNLTSRPCKLKSGQLKSLSQAMVQIDILAARLAKKIQVHRTIISRNLKKMTVKYYRRQKTPKYRDKTEKKPKKDIENRQIKFLTIRNNSFFMVKK